MVLMADGSLEHAAHVGTQTDNLICLGFSLHRQQLLYLDIWFRCLQIELNKVWN